MALCRGSYLIMGILRSRNAVDKVYGLTIDEITELEQTSKPNTVHKRIRELKELGWVDEGVKAERAKTYYLTEEGNKQLPEKNKTDKETNNEQ